MNEKVIRFKNVYFDLPYLLFVKDSMDDPNLRKWAEAYQKRERPLPYSPYAPNTERPGNIIIGGGFPVYLPPDDLAEYYTVALPQIQVGLRLLRRVNPHRSTTMMGEVPGDRAGRASFSSVKVMFDPRSISPEYHWHMALFVELAIEAINKFVSHYRIVANRPYIQPITPQVIQEFHIQTEFEDGTSQVQEFGAGGGPLHGMGGTISDQEDKSLRDAVASQASPVIFDVFDADVRDHLDLRKWRLALIDSAVLFEAWLTNFLRKKYKEQGLSEENIEAKFHRQNGSPFSITYIAKSLVKDATDFDFSQTQECSVWENKVRDVRNDIVHGTRFDVSDQEASEAYRTVREAISLLEKR